MVHIVGSISGPHHFALQKLWLQRIVVNQIFRGGAEFSSLSGVLVQNQV